MRIRPIRSEDWTPGEPGPRFEWREGRPSVSVASMEGRPRPSQCKEGERLPTLPPGAGCSKGATMRLRSKSRRRVGAVVVEMAVVLPIFIGLVMGQIESSRLGMVAQLLTTAAR